MNVGELLTPEGKKYARYVFLINTYMQKAQKIPFIGNSLHKWIMGLTVSFIFVHIMQEGAKEHARQRKTKMPGMRNRTGASRRETPRQVREVRIHDKGIRGIQALDNSSSERGTESSEENQER